MVALRVLTGSRAGSVQAVDRFPSTLGRAGTDDLQFPDVGVWENHLQLSLRQPDGFRLTRLGQGRASVNGAEFEEHTLRHGDVIELGAVKLQFWLADVQQLGHRTRELLVWLGLGALLFLEAALLCALL